MTQWHSQSNCKRCEKFVLLLYLYWTKNTNAVGTLNKALNSSKQLLDVPAPFKINDWSLTDSIKIAKKCNTSFCNFEILLF